MTPNLTKMVEEKAKELYEIHCCNRAEWKYASNIFRPNWVILARHVLASEIKARLEEMSVINKRYHNLQSQLKELESYDTGKY